MRLLTGPAGSGKTTLVLQRFREALRAQGPSVRLIVPTATLALHLRNQVAREGLVFPGGAIQTLSDFIDAWTADTPEAGRPVLHLLVEAAAHRVNRPEFAAVKEMPGFCAAVGSTIREFSSAGCDSARLAAALPETPLGPAFLAVYREVEHELSRRGLALRSQRLELAARRIRAKGLGGIKTIFLDGFRALPDPELDVIAAISAHSDVTLSLADADVTPQIRSLAVAEERTVRRAAHPQTAIVRAPSVEREVEEIARRILVQSAARPFREIGVIVRSPESYTQLLAATFERFGIPARFYFDAELDRHPAVRALTGIVDAMLSGWEHAAALRALRLAPRWVDSDVMDRFAFAVREQLPSSGLMELKSLLVGVAGGEKLIHKLESVAALEEWRSYTLLPKDWPAQLASLRTLFRPAAPGGGDERASVLLLRTERDALDGFARALADAALALDPSRQVDLSEFWRAVKSILRLSPLRPSDSRRNVVHVMDAHEARQWVLPVVFVCGMVEKQFPKFHTQDPFLPDAARGALKAAGIRIRTAADFENEEQALFDSASTRSTILVTLTYPDFDSRGDRNLRSIFLDRFVQPEEESIAVRPVPRGAPSAPPVLVRSPRLLESLAARTARVSPTALETYLRCPFQYFAQRTLRLTGPPPRPQDRLDFLTQGNIVHEVLATWWTAPQDIHSLFESVFGRVAEEKRILEAYHTERKRNAMIDDLSSFARSTAWPRDNYVSRVEEKFEFPLSDSIVVTGKIDRLDIDAAGNAWVIDYKYSAPQRTKARRTDPDLLQAPLYLLGAERGLGLKPAGVYYLGVKSGVLYVGWGEGAPGTLPQEADPFPQDWLAGAERTSLRIVSELRSGRIEPAPSDAAHCRYCDFRDVCRLTARQVETAVEGA
jgi:ATP-dependent helicase/DNAse subunit B